MTDPFIGKVGDQGKTREFRADLEALINHHSMEEAGEGGNTPDFILASYLARCLALWDDCVRERDRWYGVRLEPGQTEPDQSVPPYRIVPGKDRT
jgi:hypothetical protein